MSFIVKCYEATDHNPPWKMKKYKMEILNKNNVKLAYFDNGITISKNSDLSSVIYLTAAKLVQCRMMADNRSEK